MIQLRRYKKEGFLPNPICEEAYDEIDFKSEKFKSAALRICEENDYDVKNLETFSSGSRPVFGVEGVGIIKMFAPIHREYFEVEKRALRFLSESNFNFSPKLIAEGKVSGWHYLAMTRIEGISLKEAWSDLTQEEKNDIAKQVGEITRRLHSLDTSTFDDKDTSWSDFLKKQELGAYTRHKSLGIQNDLLADLEEFLKMVKLEKPKVNSFLHTELMRDHIFISKSINGWQVTGLIDFEPSMTGDPEYDFASVGIFVTMAEKGLFQKFLEGYGIEKKNIELSLRVMSYAILHRYSNMKWYLKFMPGGRNFEDLAKKWFR